eukprot:g4509.t1
MVEDGETRGASMVAKHLQKLQEEKEEAAATKLQSLMPNFGQLVRLSALERTDWNPEKAALLLRRFQVANASRLHQLHKKRRRILSSLIKSSSGLDPKESDSNSEKSSSFSEGSSRRRRKRKNRQSKKHRSKKEKKKHKSLRSRPTFGAYGVIREADYDWKRAEFVKWASDVKQIDTESLNKTEELKLFADYVEDYNTGTLPHKKYYDLILYERKKDAKRRKKHKGSDEEYIFNDEEERRRELERKRVEDHEKRVRAAYYELRTSEKAEDMREQEMLRLQMKLAYKTGDRKRADELAERLKPEPKKTTNSD